MKKKTGRRALNNKDRKDFRISYRISQQEKQALEKTIQKYKLKSIHQLAKSAFFEREITINTRNRSIDAINETLISYRADLNRIGNNINQITRNFNTIKAMVPQEALKLSFEIQELKKLEEVLVKNLEKIYQIWLQS